MSAALAGTVLVASLLGSLHCAGMCGGFVAFWAGGTTGRTQLAAHLAYHGGRLAAYATLGAIAGALGAAVDLAGSLAGAARPAAVLAGALMVASGAVALARALGLRVPRAPLLPGIGRFASRVYGRVRGRPPVVRALSVGACSSLLPCGWLYAFVLLAAGTGGPAAGALVLVAFWAGTVPVLAGLGAAVAALAAPLRRRMPTVTALLLIAVGLLWLTGRAAMPGPAPGAGASTTVPAGASGTCPLHGDR